MSIDTLPEGWIRVKFMDVVQNVTERVMPSSDESRLYVGLEHMQSGSLRLTGVGSDVDLVGEKLRMRKGDVLFARRNPHLRRVAVAPHDGPFSAHGMVLRTSDPRVLLQEFLPYFMQSDVVMDRANQIAVGSLSRTINWKDLKDQMFALPPIDDQRTAVELLGAADSALNCYRAAFEASHVALVTLCRELTSDQSSLVPLTSVCDVLDSARIPLNDSQRANLRGDIPYYGANGVVDYVAEAIFDEPLVLIPEDQHGGFFSLWKSKRMAYRIDGPAWVNNHAHVLRARDVPIDWLYFSLVHRDLRPWVNESTRSKLNRSALNVIPLAVPPDLNGRLDVLRAADRTRSACEANMTRMASVVTSLGRALLKVAQDVR